MKAITIFCGSSLGNKPKFKSQAFLVGSTLAKRGIDVVYGGANIGLMGAVADGSIQNGGRVIGVLPKFMRDKKLAHGELTKLIVVESMHERKSIMNNLSDGSIALPGGFGTLEELFEMLTWSQLGIHNKPIGILNVEGYYDHLVALLQSMVDNGLLKLGNQKLLLVSENVDDLLDRMHNYKTQKISKWSNKDIM